MSKTVLITRPNYDITTKYFHQWSEEVIRLAAERKNKVLDLEGKKANRKTFESYAKKHRPDFFFFNGHGSDTLLAGYDNEPILISDADNNSICSRSIVYVRSCSAAKVLGVSLIKYKASAFIGYVNKFGFMRLVQKESKPLSDPLARMFLAPSNLVATTLLKGHPAIEAHQRSLREMRKNLSKLLSSENPLSDSTGAVLLWSNIRGQTLLGNPNAVI